MKRALSLVLSLALAAALALPALAAGTDSAPAGAPLLISAAPTAAITLNGEALDVSALPAAPGANMLPMRLVAESDHGSASWYQEENSGAFYFNSSYITVDFSDFSIKVDDVAVEGTAAVVAGVTFIPAAVLDGMEGFSATCEEDGTIAVTTPNGAPLVKLGYAIQEASGQSMLMPGDISAFAENYSLAPDTFAEGITFMGMNTNADALVLGKLAEGADVEAVKAAMETYRANLEATYSWYLSEENMPKVENAKLVVNGDYVLFLVAEDADSGLEVFNAFVASNK